MRPKTASGNKLTLKIPKPISLTEYQSQQSNHEAFKTLQNYSPPQRKNSLLALHPSIPSHQGLDSFSEFARKPKNIMKNDLSQLDEFKKVFEDISTLQKLDSLYPTYVDTNIEKFVPKSSQNISKTPIIGYTKGKRASIGIATYEIPFNQGVKLQEKIILGMPKTNSPMENHHKASKNPTSVTPKPYGAHSPALTRKKLQEIITQEAQKNELSLKPFKSESYGINSPINAPTKKSLEVKRIKTSQNGYIKQFTTSKKIVCPPLIIRRLVSGSKTNNKSNQCLEEESCEILKKLDQVNRMIKFEDSFEEAYGKVESRKGRLEKLDFLDFNTPKEKGYLAYSMYKHKRSQSLAYKA